MRLPWINVHKSQGIGGAGFLCLLIKSGRGLMPKSMCMILLGHNDYVYKPSNFLGGILTNIKWPPSTLRRVLWVLYEVGDQLCGIEIWHTQHTYTRVDRLVSEHLSTQRMWNPYTFCLCFWSSKNICSPPPYTFSFCFWSSKNICNPPPNASNAAWIAQYEKGMHKLWGVQCKGTQSLMMSELKQIRILSSKSLVVAFLLPKNKEVL
jgi:hypothetical protein